MSFKTDLCVKVIGKQAFEVTSPLVYNDDIVQLTVHQGFDFDGASVPRGLWSLIGSPMTDGYQRAGCLHDALYASNLLDRDLCDQLFLNAMKSDGVRYTKRYAMYWAVRAFGGSAYENDNKGEIDAYRELIDLVYLV